jgi:proteic killer suppression protein
MIINLADQTTEDIFHGFDTKQARRIPSVVCGIALRKLDMVNATHELKDLRVPPGNRLKQLKGRSAGSYSIRINDQFRIVFKWIEGNAKDVLITDYH